MSGHDDASDPAPMDAAAFDPAAEARRLMRVARHASLATLDGAGSPSASLIAVATDTDGTPLTLISRLAVHTRNLEKNPACSILFAELGGGDPLAHPRVSVTARAQKAEGERERRRFLARNPAAEIYAGFADFAFYRLAPVSAHLVAGFGRIVNLQADELLTDCAGADAVLAAEAEAVAHVNQDHRDTLSLYARSAGRAPVVWRMSGLDPDGFDLISETDSARVSFPERVTTPGGLRAALQALAERARAVG